ncbi:cytochrome c peroxidase [Salmonella enterica]|nr:cytochrome c peroxidase [Salmonella enterica]
MKKITLYATTVITVGLLCYLGLSGMYGITTNSAVKKAMCRPRLWVKIIKYWVISERKDVIIVIRRPLNYLFIPLFRWQSS